MYLRLYLFSIFNRYIVIISQWLSSPTYVWLDYFRLDVFKGGGITAHHDGRSQVMFIHYFQRFEVIVYKDIMYEE